jgi:hypothetical protein
MTTIFFARPEVMYFATASIVRDSRASGGILSSMGEEASWPILKDWPLPFPFPFQGLFLWSLCLRPMIAIVCGID